MAIICFICFLALLLYLYQANKHTKPPSDNPKDGDLFRIKRVFRDDLEFLAMLYLKDGWTVKKQVEWGGLFAPFEYSVLLVWDEKKARRHQREKAVERGRDRQYWQKYHRDEYERNEAIRQSKLPPLFRKANRS